MSDKRDRDPKQGPQLLQFPEVLQSRRDKRPRFISRLLSDPLVVDPDPIRDAPILYQHSVLCQTCLPYRDPGDVRSWERANGLVNLLVSAGQAFSSQIGKFVEVGLPFGPKPRLVLYHLNAEALRTQSPVIELEDSLTAFVKRTLGLDTKGRNIRTVNTASTTCRY